jgi:hypothetical protein
MVDLADTMTWAMAAALLAFLLVLGFVVSWVATDVLDVSRQRYIGLLALATALATVVVAWQSDTTVADMVTHHWVQGVLAGVATGVVVAAAIRKIPATLQRSGHDLHVAEAWEGVVYGISEGVLLSGLPAFVAWQAATDADWGTASAWAAGLVASAAMIAVHHFGYWDYRNRQVLVVVGGCLILTVGYLATGSLLAPALGHVLMHVSGITKGVELPPHRHPSAAAAA